MTKEKRIEVLEGIADALEREIVLCAVNLRYAARGMIEVNETQQKVLQGQIEQLKKTEEELQKKLDVTNDELTDTKNLPTSPSKKIKKGNG